MEAGLNYLFAKLGLHNTAVLIGILKVMWDMKIDYKAHVAKCEGKFDVINTEITEVKKDVSENTKQIKTHNSLIMELKEKWSKNGSGQETGKETKKKRK